MPTYQEKWESMSTEAKEEMGEQVGVVLTALIDNKDNIRLNDEFKSWAAEAILLAITKNHATIHYYKKFCEENDLSTFETLGICLKHYKLAVETENKRETQNKSEST